MTGASERLVVGKVTGAHGVRGWVRLYSETRPRANLLTYSPWQLSKDGQFVTCEVLQSREQSNGLVALLAGCEDRDGAEALVGADIFIHRSQLPAPGQDEVYWSDLIGCVVRTGAHAVLGEVTGLIETGDYDVLVVRGRREHLIPFVMSVYIQRVDLDEQIIEVDWEEEA